MSRRKRVAFMSERNVCRSIIAQAYLLRHGRDEFEAISFGLNPDRVHYLVHEVLSERGFNMNYFFSKAYEVVEKQPFDILVLMHPDLKEKLPRINHSYELQVWNFTDPTLEKKSRDELKKDIENLCDQIESQVKNLILKYKEVGISVS